MLEKIKNNRWLILILLIVTILIIEFVRVMRFFDISGIKSISADAWLSFAGSIVQTVIATMGLLIAWMTYLREIKEKEKPSIIIKSTAKEQYNYVCNTEDREYTQHAKVYVELINKGNEIVKNPRIKDSKNRISNLYKNGTECELDIIEPEFLQTNNKYVICIDINYMEGMGEFIINTFEFQCRNYKGKWYTYVFEIEIARHDNKTVKTYMKNV